MDTRAGHDRPIHPWVAAGWHTIRFGIFGGPGSDWAAAIAWAQMVEELGFDSYWAGDHPVLFPFDCWTHLAVVASATKHLRLGPLVACALYRHPIHLARLAADADRLSGGRLVLALGSGDAPTEFAHLGLRWGSLRERQTALEEVARVLPALWSEQPVTFAGQHVRLSEVQISAGPVQQPHVPLMIAGGGERVTLRQVARYADAANFGPGSLTGAAWTPADVRHKYDVLRDHCAALGRPYEAILRTHVSFGLRLRTTGGRGWERRSDPLLGFAFDRLVGRPDDAIAYFRELAAAGVQYFIVHVGSDTETLRLLASEVVPAVANA